MSKNITAAIIVAIGFIMFFVLALPAYDYLGASRTLIAAKQALVDERTQEVNNFNTAKQQATLHEGDIAKIAVVMPVKKQIDEVVSSIQAATVTSGMQLVDLSTATVITPDQLGYQKIFINVNLTGQYTAFVNLLRTLEQSLRLYNINEISASMSTGPAGGVNFSLKIYSYYLTK
jgi:Tfp pilus assembly protein PilO